MTINGLTRNATVWAARSMFTVSMRFDNIKTQKRDPAPYRLAGDQTRLSSGPVGPRHCQAAWHCPQHPLQARSAPRMVEGRDIRLTGSRVGPTARPCRQVARASRKYHRRCSIGWRRGHGFAGEPGGPASQALSDHRENHQHGRPVGRGGWTHGLTVEQARP